MTLTSTPRRGCGRRRPRAPRRRGSATKPRTSRSVDIITRSPRYASLTTGGACYDGDGLPLAPKLLDREAELEWAEAKVKQQRQSDGQSRFDQYGVKRPLPAASPRGALVNPVFRAC
jgi:hypothetical protein